MLEHRIEQAVVRLGDAEAVVGARRIVLRQVDRHAADAKRLAAIRLDANRRFAERSRRNTR